MINITIREPRSEDKAEFIAAMIDSQTLHQPWIKAPLTSLEFDEFLLRSQQPNQRSFLVLDSNKIVGVINLSEIVRGSFQNAFISFYAVANTASKGYMSQGLKLVLKTAFDEIDLHRLEANIQPHNLRSLQLIKANGFRYEGFSPRYLKINDEWRGHERWAMTLEDYIQNDESIIEKDSIDLVPYDPTWPALAESEMVAIRKALPFTDIVDVQHVGSTAIHNLSAKPIIDIQIAVKSIETMKIIAVPALQKLGYEYWADNPDPSRMFLVKGMPPFGKGRTHHIHIFEPGSKHWANKIIFRDYLIAHPKLADEYQALKYKLAQQYTYDREEYTNAKGEFVEKVLALAKTKG